MTRELLESKRTVLQELERSELEAQRLDKALDRVRIVSEDGPAAQAAPTPSSAAGPSQGSPSTPRKAGAASYGLFGALTHTFQGMVDVDPESTRRNSIGKTRESIHEVCSCPTYNLMHLISSARNT